MLNRGSDVYRSTATSPFILDVDRITLSSGTDFIRHTVFGGGQSSVHWLFGVGGVIQRSWQYAFLQEYANRRRTSPNISMVQVRVAHRHSASSRDTDRCQELPVVLVVCCSVVRASLEEALGHRAVV